MEISALELEVIKSEAKLEGIKETAELLGFTLDDPEQEV